MLFGGGLALGQGSYREDQSFELELKEPFSTREAEVNVAAG